jgi:integrase
MSTVDTGRRAYSVAELRSMLYTTLNQPIQQSAIWWWRLLTGMCQAEILGAELDHLHIDAPNHYYELTGSLAEIPREHGCGTPANGKYPCGHAKGGLCAQAKWRIPDGFTMRPLQGRLCIKTPKSGRLRMVPIVPQLAEVMRRYFDATKDVPNPHGLIFRNPDGSP